MEGNAGVVTNMNNNNNKKQDRRDSSPATRLLGSGRAGSGGRLDDASWIQTRESRSREPSLLHSLQRDKLTPKRLSTGRDDSGWIKSSSSSTTRRSTGSDDPWLRSPQRMRRVATDSWSGSGAGAAGPAAGAASEAVSGAARSSASGASSGTPSSVVNRWNASILEPGKLRIKAEDSKSWIKSDIKDTRSGSGRIQHNPEPIRAIHTPDLALHTATDPQHGREAKLRPSDMGDVKLRLQSFEQGLMQSDSAVRTRERSRDRDRSQDREFRTKDENILKSAIAKFDMVSKGHKNTNKPETDENANRKYERRLRTVRTRRKHEEEVSEEDKDEVTVSEGGNQGQTDRPRDDQSAISKDDVTVITGGNHGDPNNTEIENMSVPHEPSNPTATTQPQVEGVVTTLEGTSRIGRRQRRHDPPVEREERTIQGQDSAGIEADSSVNGEEAALTVTDSSTVTHQDSDVKGADTESMCTIEDTNSALTPEHSNVTSKGTIPAGAEVPITHTDDDVQNTDGDCVPIEETYTAQGSITLFSVSPTVPHTDKVTLRGTEADKGATVNSNDGVVQDEGVVAEEHSVSVIQETRCVGEGVLTPKVLTRDAEVIETKTETNTPEGTPEDVQLTEEVVELCDKEEVTETQDDPQWSIECDVSQGHGGQVKVTEVNSISHPTEDGVQTGEAHTHTTVTHVTENTVTNTTDNAVTDVIEHAVTNDIENSVTNDLVDMADIQKDTVQASTADVTLHGAVSDITDTDSKLDVTSDIVTESQIEETVTETVCGGMGTSETQDTVPETVCGGMGTSETQDTVPETVCGSMGTSETQDTIHDTYTDTSSYIDTHRDIHITQDAVTPSQSVYGCHGDQSITVCHDKEGGASNNEELLNVSGDRSGVPHGSSDQNVSMSSTVTEDVIYVTDDDTDSDTAVSTKGRHTPVTVSQEDVQNLDDTREGDQSGEREEEGVSNMGVSEGSIHTLVGEKEVELQPEENKTSTSEITTSDGAEETLQDVEQEEQGPHVYNNESTAYNDDITQGDGTETQLTHVLQDDSSCVENDTVPESVHSTGTIAESAGTTGNARESSATADTIVTKGAIQLRYDGKHEVESAVKIIVAQVKDIRGESEGGVEPESQGCVEECSEEAPGMVSVRETVIGDNDDVNNELDMDNIPQVVGDTEVVDGGVSPHSPIPNTQGVDEGQPTNPNTEIVHGVKLPESAIPNTETVCRTGPPGTNSVMTLAQAALDITSMGECGNQTEIKVSERLHNEPNGENHRAAHYIVGADTPRDNTLRAEGEETSQRTLEPTQVEHSTQVSSQPSIEPSHQSTATDTPVDDLTVRAGPDGDLAGFTDHDKGVISSVYEDYVYVDTPPTLSDTDDTPADTHGVHQMTHEDQIAPGEYQMTHEDHQMTHENHQIVQSSESSPEWFGSHDEAEGAGFDVREDDARYTGQEPEAVNVDVLAGSPPTDIEGHTEYGTPCDIMSYQDHTQTNDYNTDIHTLQQHPVVGDHIDDHSIPDHTVTDEHLIQDYIEDDQALLSQGYSRLRDDEDDDGDDDDNTITHVMYMDEVEIPSDDDSNGDYGDNDTEEEVLDSDEEAEGSGGVIAYPWGVVERAWGLETIQERPEGFDSEHEEEKRAPLAQMESSEDDEEWIEEYTFIHHETEDNDAEDNEAEEHEEVESEGSEGQGGNKSEEVPLITSAIEPQESTDKDIIDDMCESSKMEYKDEAPHDGVTIQDDIHTVTPHHHPETTISEDNELNAIGEGLLKQRDSHDFVPHIDNSLTIPNSSTDTRSTVEGQDMQEEGDCDTVDGLLSLVQNVGIIKDTESSESEAMRSESVYTIYTRQEEEDCNNNQTSAHQCNSEGVTGVAEVMSLAVLSEAILALHSPTLHSPTQTTTQAAEIEQSVVSTEVQPDPPSGHDITQVRDAPLPSHHDSTHTLSEESLTAIAEAISSSAVSEAILSVLKEELMSEETVSGDIKDTELSVSAANTAEGQGVSHRYVSENCDSAEDKAEAISDVIISEASMLLLSCPIVKDDLSQSDSDSDGCEDDSRRLTTVDNTTLGVIADYMSTEVMSDVLVTLQSHSDKWDEEESEGSDRVETGVIVNDRSSLHDSLADTTIGQTPAESCSGTVDVGGVEVMAEGMSQDVITETMATLQQTETMATLQQTETMATLQQTLTESRSKDCNTLDDKRNNESMSAKLHIPYVDEQGPDFKSSEPGKVKESVDVDMCTQDTEQEAPVVAATSVGQTVDTVQVSERVTVSKTAEVTSVTDEPPHIDHNTRRHVEVVNEHVTEISETDLTETIVPSSETESRSNVDKSSAVLSVEVTSEGQTKDGVQSTSDVCPSKLDAASNDGISLGDLINTENTLKQAVHSENLQEDSVIKSQLEATSETSSVSEVKSKTGTKVARVREESTGTTRRVPRDIKVEPGLSTQEKTQLLREMRSRLSPTVTRKDQDKVESEARYRRPRRPPPTEEELEMKHLVTWLCTGTPRTGDTKRIKMLNGDEDVCYDTLILEVFEESETIFFPIVQQKEARAFVKALHMKGVTYEALCQEVGEHEHNFTSWRKSLGRAGIGHAVMQWVNRPLQDLLDDEEEVDEDDGMDDADIQAEERKVNEERLREEEGQRRLQGTTHTDNVNKDVDHNKNDQKDAHDQNNTAKTNGVTMRRPKEPSPPPAHTKAANDNVPQRQKYEQEPDPIRLKRLEEFKKTQEKDDAEPVQDIRKRISLFEKQQSPSKSGSESREESESGEVEEESRTETESISSGSMDEPTESSPEPPSEPRPKSPEPPVVIEDIITVQQEAMVEEAPFSATTNGRSSREASPKDTTPPPAATDNKPRDQTDSGSNIPDVNENYNSDLDPDNEMHSPVQAIAAKKIASSRVNKTWSGFIFVFSDTPANSETCRVKVGASAFPHKRLRQAQLFNPDMYQVHTVAVKQRSAALEQVLAELNPYRLSSQKDWFEGPFNDLLAAISDVAARFPSSRKIIDNNADDGDGESAC